MIKHTKIGLHFAKVKVLRAADEENLVVVMTYV